MKIIETKKAPAAIVLPQFVRTAQKNHQWHNI